jgi:hypothetical protein
MKAWTIRFWPILVIILAALIFFHPFFLQGKIPMPADLIVGAYLPWHDYKWLGYEAGVPVKNPLISDVPSVIYPQRLIAIEQMKEGKLPLWNPYMFSGYPLMAAFQTAAFYPLNVLYFILPFVSAWSLQVILQPILSGIFAYLFLKNLKLDKLSSLFGAIIYSYSGFNLFFLEFNVHAHVASYIPIFLLLIDKYLVKNKILYLVILSFTLAIQIFAGYPQLTFFTLILCFFWFLFRVGLKKSGTHLIKGGIISIFVILGLLLSSIQLIPGFELFAFSQRGSEDLMQELRFLPPQEIVTIIFPDYFGNSSTNNFWGPGNYANAVGYSSMVGFILAILSLFNFRKRKEIAFFSLVSLACLLLVVDSPLSNFLVNNFLPGSKALSMSRLFVLLSFSIAVLAGIGLSLLKEKIEFKSYLSTLTVLTITTLPLILGTYLSWGYLFLQRKALINISQAMEVFEPIYKNYTVSARNLVLPASFMIAALGFLFLIYKYKSFISIGKFLLVFLTIVELFRFGWKITPFSEQGFLFPKTPVVDFLEAQEKPFRIISDDVMPANMWVPSRFEAPDGYDAAYPELQAKLIGVINSQKAEALSMTRYGRLEKDSFETNYIDFTNTKYILTTKRDTVGNVDKDGLILDRFFDKQKFKKVFEDKSVVIMENTKALNRAFFVSDWESFNDDKKILNAILDPKLNPGKKIILKSYEPKFKKSDSHEASITQSNFSSDFIKIEVSSNEPGFLFLSETFFPGWKALVNQEEVPIINANYAFKAIPLMKGQNSVKVIYSPLSFKIGAILSVFSFLVLVGITLYQKKK